MKRKITLFTALLVVPLIGSVSIFHACQKNDRDGDLIGSGYDTKIENLGENPAENFTNETEFVAKINEQTCVLVNVYRDDHDNAHITTTEVAPDPDVAKAVILSGALDIKPRQTEDGEGILIEIPNDAIYWLVPLDGTKPVKFEPVKDEKAALGNNRIIVKCTCISSRVNCTTGNACLPPRIIKKEDESIIIDCVPVLTSCCMECVPKTSASTGAFFVPVSSYLLKSNTIDFNGLRYK